MASGLISTIRTYRSSLCDLSRGDFDEQKTLGRSRYARVHYLESCHELMKLNRTMLLRRVQRLETTESAGPKRFYFLIECLKLLCIISSVLSARRFASLAVSSACSAVWRVS